MFPKYQLVTPPSILRLREALPTEAIEDSVHTLSIDVTEKSRKSVRFSGEDLTALQSQIHEESSPLQRDATHTPPSVPTQLRQGDVLDEREHTPSSDVTSIPFAALSIEEEPVGFGSAKSVHRGKWEGKTVAVLTLRSGTCDTEASVFAKLGTHPHLVKMLGTSEDGDTKHYEDEDFTPSNKVLIRCALQVCGACEQLMECKVIHRDIASRNVLVFDFDNEDESRVKVKLSDYGLTKDGQYYYGQGNEIPMRWVPPETIVRRKWSEKSDVWAFGVLLWEMWSAAAIPFAFVANDEEVARKVVDGERLPQPDGCPDVVYKLMEQCWKKSPKDRPSFADIQHKLLEAYAVESSHRLCVICMDEKAACVAAPCGHQCVCEDDARTLQNRNSNCPEMKAQARDLKTRVSDVKQEDVFRTLLILVLLIVVLT